MLLLIRELHHLVLDRRAIARADRRNLPRVHGRAADVFADDAQRLRSGVCDVTGDLPLRQLRRAKLKGVGSASPGCSAKRLQSIVRPSSRGGVAVLKRQPRRPSRFERLAQQHAGWFAAAAGRVVFFAAVNQAIEKGAGGDHHRSGHHPAPIAQAQPAKVLAPSASPARLAGRRLRPA